MHANEQYLLCTSMSHGTLNTGYQSISHTCNFTLAHRHVHTEMYRLTKKHIHIYSATLVSRQRDEERKGEKKKSCRETDRAKIELGQHMLCPSIIVSVMWLWAVWVLCHYIHNACCLSQHTLSITHVHTFTHTWRHCRMFQVKLNTV